MDLTRKKNTLKSLVQNKLETLISTIKDNCNFIPLCHFVVIFVQKRYDLVFHEDEVHRISRFKSQKCRLVAELKVILTQNLVFIDLLNAMPFTETIKHEEYG